MVRRTTGVALALMALLAACGTDDPSVTAEQSGRAVVVTALHPLAEAIERIAGDAVVVIDLVPVGDSAHELELTARQRDEVLDADLVVVLGNGFQPELEGRSSLPSPTRSCGWRRTSRRG
jgi:ABC-type Zn uptake system ZnuABC Zn-binding protein ZnuA